MTSLVLRAPTTRTDPPLVLTCRSDGTDLGSAPAKISVESSTQRGRTENQPFGTSGAGIRTAPERETASRCVESRHRRNAESKRIPKARFEFVFKRKGIRRLALTSMKSRIPVGPPARVTSSMT